MTGTIVRALLALVLIAVPTAAGALLGLFLVGPCPDSGRRAWLLVQFFGATGIGLGSGCLLAWRLVLRRS
jgi:hypothetical protein